MFSRLLNFYKKHRIFFNVGFALLGWVFGLFTYLNPYESSAKLEYLLIDKIDVISISKDVGGLEIFFNKKDIRKDSLNLKMYKVRLQNNGGRSINQRE